MSSARSASSRKMASSRTSSCTDRGSTPLAVRPATQARARASLRAAGWFAHRGQRNQEPVLQQLQQLGAERLGAGRGHQDDRALLWLAGACLQVEAQISHQLNPQVPGILAHGLLIQVVQEKHRPWLPHGVRERGILQLAFHAL